MDDWPLLLECYPIPQICTVKRWLLRDEVSTKKTLNCCDLILSQGLSGWYEVLKLATKFKTALILSSGNSWGIVYTPDCKRQDSHKIIRSQYFAPISIFPFFHDRLQRSTQKLVDTCHADETHTASSNLTVCKSYKMRSDEISAISTAIPLQCPIDRAILDCTNVQKGGHSGNHCFYQIQDVE